MKGNENGFSHYDWYYSNVGFNSDYCGRNPLKGELTMNNATDEDYLRDEAQKDMEANKLTTPIGPGYEFSTGCWIDENWGHYGVARLVDIAQDLGMEISGLDESAVWAYRNNEDEFQDEQTGEYHNASDWLFMQGGLGDEAEEWLNDNIAKPGFYFGWYEGGFFLMPTEWWNEEI